MLYLACFNGLWEFELRSLCYAAFIHQVLSPLSQGDSVVLYYHLKRKGLLLLFVIISFLHDIFFTPLFLLLILLLL